ncbi:MAG: sensor histidine kinase [Acetanaerobacterium sp.]
MSIRKRLYRSIILFMLLSIALILIVSSVISNYTFRTVRSELKESASLHMSQLLNHDKLSQEDIVEYISLTLSDVAGTADIALTRSFFYLVAACSIIILGTAGYLTHRTSRWIMIPLEQLKNGADHIKAENLDYEITYREQNEFGDVCHAFTEMQTHLKTTIQENLQYEQSRKSLIAGISHDLRTPLTTIKGYSKGLQDDVVTESADRELYVKTIYSKACEMESLVEQLFLFSKLDIGKELFYFEQISGNQYVTHCIEDALADMESQGLHIQFHTSIDDKTMLRMDCIQFHRVFSNIFKNSIKYKQKHDCTITITTSLRDQWFVIEIGDDGLGVPEESLPYLFQSFYRVDTARSEQYKGSGLGLSIVEKIVKAHNGTIDAKNSGGLMITIRLPIQEARR